MWLEGRTGKDEAAIMADILVPVKSHDPLRLVVEMVVKDSSLCETPQKGKSTAIRRVLQKHVFSALEDASSSVPLSSDSSQQVPNALGSMLPAPTFLGSMLLAPHLFVLCHQLPLSWFYAASTPVSWFHAMMTPVQQVL